MEIDPRFAEAAKESNTKRGAPTAKDKAIRSLMRTWLCTKPSIREQSHAGTDVEWGSMVPPWFLRSQLGTCFWDRTRYCATLRRRRHNLCRCRKAVGQSCSLLDAGDMHRCQRSDRLICQVKHRFSPISKRCGLARHCRRHSFFHTRRIRCVVLAELAQFAPLIRFSTPHFPSSRLNRGIHVCRTASACNRVSNNRRILLCSEPNFASRTKAGR
jgi:hypothetical protein